VTIRTFQPGDEAAQVALYNEAAADLPKFKPATLVEVRRRTSARDFDPGQRFFAVQNGQPVGYAVFTASGRVSFPWCRPGHEDQAGPLFDAVISALQVRGFHRAFAAYRADWGRVLDFFGARGFAPARTMVNFALDVVDLPTVSHRPSSPIVPLESADLPALLQAGQGILRFHEVGQLEEYFFRNPYFRPDAAFVMRPRTGPALAFGLLVDEPTYADPRQVDANMPCFRLGAFGTEGTQTKRIKGMFSLLAAPDRNFGSLAMDLLGHAALKLADSDDVDCLAAQVPSDAPHLLRFYEQHFRRQGSFPILERNLAAPGS
jgi:hypothetical protein